MRGKYPSDSTHPSGASASQRNTGGRGIPAMVDAPTYK